MLSAGKFYQSVPRELLPNLDHREQRYLPSFSPEQIKEEMERCTHDLLYFVNTYVWQYNPNSIGTGSPELGAFITWPFQDEAFKVILACVEDRHDLCIEKSREMGASWMCLILFDWLFLFHPWKKFLAISRSAEAVDKPGDPDSLFWKLDFIHDHLPDWMVKDRIVRRKMAYSSPITKSTITGQASTGKAGVGGRCTAMFIDEFSRIDEDYEVLHQTSDTTGCRIFNFTHFGIDKAAFEISQRADMKKLNLHWTQHPDKRKGLYRYRQEKNDVEVLDKTYAFPASFNFVMVPEPTGGPYPALRSPWYDEQCRRKGSSRAVAMDLDINPRGADSQFFNGLTIIALKETYCRPPVWVGELHCDRDLGRPIGLVPLDDGPLKLWITADHKGKMPPGRYAIGCDVSTGSGTTNSCVSIADAGTGEKVGEYTTCTVDAKKLAPIVVALCWLFKSIDGEGAKLAWEIPGPGQAFGQTVIELGYRNVYYRTNETDINPNVSTMPGWCSTIGNKLALLEEYRAALDMRLFLNRSAEALDECLSFKYLPSGGVAHGGEKSVNDPSGALINHGDHVIADALAWKMAKLLGRPEKKKQEEQAPLGSLAWRRELHHQRQREEMEV